MVLSWCIATALGTFLLKNMADQKVRTLSSGSRYIQIDNAMVGVHKVPAGQDYVPTRGESLAQWNPDISDWDTSANNICTTARWSGTNGRDHWVVRAFGITSGIYPQGQIVGFEWDEGNDSTRNHCIYLKRYGFALTKNNAYNFVDAGGDMNQPSSYSRHREHTLDAETLRRLKDGWCFAEFRIQLSTKTGGTGTNPSNFTIKNWRFKFKHDGGSGDMIIPANRPYSDREDGNSIGVI